MRACSKLVGMWWAYTSDKLGDALLVGHVVHAGVDEVRARLVIGLVLSIYMCPSPFRTILQ